MKGKFFALWSVVVCTWITLAMAQNATAQSAAKPVLMMGAGYSSHDRAALRRDILEPNELTFEDGGEFTSAELWNSYSLVIVTHGLPELNEREIGWIQDFLNEGGRLLLTGPLLNSLRNLKGKDRDWIGADGYQVARGEGFTISEEGKKRVPDEAAAQAIFGISNSFAPAKLAGAQALVSKGNAVVLYRHAYGKGEVWFAGMEYFRILNSTGNSAEKLRVGKPARDFLEKLILQGGAQKKSDQISAGLKALGASAPVLWRRDFSHARGAAFSSPPFPETGETLQNIRLDLGRDEWESVPLYLSNTQADANFAVTLSDLVSTDGKSKIPASGMRLRVQGLAAPHVTVGPFWLLDAPRRDGAANSFSVPLKANGSNTLWLTLNTDGVAAGEYSGKISFSNPAMKPLDFQIKVWPVDLPGREYFEMHATYLWNSLMNGQSGKSYDFPNPPGDMKPYENHIANMAAHHVSFNADNSWSNRYGRSVSLKNVRLRDSGEPLESALKKGLVKENALPALDFSYFDPFVETPLLAGLPYFHFNFKNTPNDWIGYAREITGDKELAPNSPRHLAVKRWLLGEIVGYLKSKGITKIVSFIADEIPPGEIPSVLQRAQMLRDFGIRVEFTATGHVGQSRENITTLNPVIDRWIWNSVIMPQAKSFVNSANSPIDKTDEQYTYVADWHRAPYVFNRARGAYCAYHELDGIFIHGYLRWYPNGGAIWKTPSGPIDTEGWEGARDGIEDARYWKRAQFLLKATKQKPSLAAEAARIEKQMAHWVSSDPQSPVELKDASYSIYKFQSPVSSYEKLQSLKRELLTALLWLEEKVPTSPGLEYSGLTLVAQGKPQAQLVGNAAAIAELNKVLAERGLPQLSTNVAETKIALGTRAELETLVGKEFLGDANPHAGKYQVLKKGNTVAVLGGDEAGVLRGARILGQLVEHSESVL